MTTTKRRTLKDLKAAYASKNEGQSNGNRGPSDYYPFWDMEFNSRVVVRFIPDLNEDNPLGFLEERAKHVLNVNGQRQNVQCLKNYGEDCPICRTSADFYKAEDQEQGRKYYKKRSWVGQVLIVEDTIKPGGVDMTGKVMKISLTKQVYEIIKEAIMADEEESGLVNDPHAIGGLDDDTDDWGHDFVIKKTKQGEHASYSTGTKFLSKPRGLTDEEVEAIKEAQIELSSTLPRNPGIDRVTAMLNADLVGEDYDAEEFEQPKPQTKPALKKPAKPVEREVEDEEVEDKPVKPARAAKPAKQAEEATAPWDGDDETAPAPKKEAATSGNASAVMEMLKARRAAAAAAKG